MELGTAPRQGLQGGESDCSSVSGNHKRNNHDDGNEDDDDDEEEDDEDEGYKEEDEEAEDDDEDDEKATVMMMKMVILNDEDDNDNRRQQQQQQKTTTNKRPAAMDQQTTSSRQQPTNNQHPPLATKTTTVKSFNHHTSISPLEVWDPGNSMIDAYPGYYSPNVPQRRGRVQQGSWLVHCAIVHHRWDLKCNIGAVRSGFSWHFWLILKSSISFCPRKRWM